VEATMNVDEFLAYLFNRVTTPDLAVHVGLAHQQRAHVASTVPDPR
jgi:hypothetical protein